MNELYLKPSHRAVPVALLPSNTLTADNVHTTDGGVDMGAFHQALFVATCGAFGSGGAATAELEQATQADFSDAKLINGRAAVDVAADKPLLLQVRSGDLDINNGFRFVRAKITTAGGSLKAGMVAFGFDARSNPAEPLAGTVID